MWLTLVFRNGNNFRFVSVVTPITKAQKEALAEDGEELYTTQIGVLTEEQEAELIAETLRTDRW